MPIEEILLPVGINLLKNAAVSAFNYFRERGEPDEHAKVSAIEKLEVTRSNVERSMEEIIGGTLTEENKDELRRQTEESVSVLPIEKGLATMAIARYFEIPVAWMSKTEVWMEDPTLVRTATNHAWIEKQLENCISRLGYGLVKGRRLKSGVVNLFVDISASGPTEPCHHIYVDVICSPEPYDYKLASLLYDIETAGELQKDDWFFIATHGIFASYATGIITRAKAKAEYDIAGIDATAIKDLREAYEQDDPAKILNILRELVKK